MFSPTRLGLKIPDSPIEQRALRPRSFRRSVLVACCVFLIFATIHSANVQNDLRRKLANELEFHGKASFNWLSQSRHVNEHQESIKTSRMKAGGRPANIEQQAKRLPDVVRIPFEEAVSDIILQGWEDAWYSSATFDNESFGPIPEPKIDFVYSWVNGSEQGFKDIKREYELMSPLNDISGKWISRHSINRYRDWDELKYSFRSLDEYAKSYVNKIQLLINPVRGLLDQSMRPQTPSWLKDDAETRQNVQVLSQEDFFGDPQKQCLPSFDSVSIETQIQNTPSDVDQLVALSDDMFLGAPHSAADFFSPLFGSMLSFKQDHYNVKDISKVNVPTFGEKPYLHYTSWLLNHRFGERERKVQAHLTHSTSRRVMQEAMASFPRPALRGACERFRGESKFQVYPWYAVYHYSIERFREALLWSFIMTRGDANGDGYLDWTERQAIISAIQPGCHAFSGGDASTPARTAEGREELLWTSLDGPETIRTVKCHNFHIDKCFTESFDSSLSDTTYPNPDFSASNIFTHLSRREPKCGDCVLKFLLSTVPRGLEPLLPPANSHSKEREMIIKALVKYQHAVTEPDALFVMVKDAVQAEHELLERTIRRGKRVSQWCLNDDVMTEDEDVVRRVNEVIQTVFKTLFPRKGRWEK